MRMSASLLNAIFITRTEIFPLNVDIWFTKTENFYYVMFCLSFFLIKGISLESYVCFFFSVYLYICLFSSEKALVERAFELRMELENAASDVSSLFAKIGFVSTIKKPKYFLDIV